MHPKRLVAIATLCALGSGRIAYLHFSIEHGAQPPIDRRYQTLRAALDAAGVPVEAQLGYFSDEPVVGGATALQALTEQRRYLDALYALAPRRLAFGDFSAPWLVADFADTNSLAVALRARRMRPIGSPVAGLALVRSLR